MKKSVISIYHKLYDYFGAQHWWPGESAFEVMVGAVLTQNTNWSNVEKAINNLKQKRMLKLDKLHKLPHKKLSSFIRPAGYYNIKAKRLKNLLSFLMNRYKGDLKLMAENDTRALREELLSVNGVGQETADSILLYALDKPVFVIDAYTKRIFSRHGFASEGVTYEELQDLFMKNIKKDVKLFNEYHALLVRLGKEFCLKKKGRCEACPLR